jgi:hypothetical protein
MGAHVLLPCTVNSKSKGKVDLLPLLKGSNLQPFGTQALAPLWPLGQVPLWCIVYHYAFLVVREFIINDYVVIINNTNLISFCFQTLMELDGMESGAEAEAKPTDITSWFRLSSIRLPWRHRNSRHTDVEWWRHSTRVSRAKCWTILWINLWTISCCLVTMRDPMTYLWTVAVAETTAADLSNRKPNQRLHV